MIEVGEYVRTNKGISKVIRKESNFLYEVDLNGTTNMGKIAFKNYIHIDDVIKHSEDKIEILKKGDLIKTINGCVFEINEIRISNFNSIIFVDDYKIELHEEDIKTILTKELFEANCYKVKEE